MKQNLKFSQMKLRAALRMRKATGKKTMNSYKHPLSKGYHGEVITALTA
jgi:hypothetical protein